MADYIERQEAINAVSNMLRRKFAIGGDLGAITLKDIPSADVQPVRHGHWTETTEPCGWTDEDCAECSECHNTFVLGEYTIGDVRELFRYCPNCGARMDEGSEE